MEMMARTKRTKRTERTERTKMTARTKMAARTKRIFNCHTRALSDTGHW